MSTKIPSLGLTRRTVTGAGEGLPNDDSGAASSARTTLLPRRTVLRTAAWSAPTVSVVVASPALAASSPGPTEFRIDHTPAPNIDSQTLGAQITVTNPTATSLTVTVLIPMSGPGRAYPHGYTAQAGWVFGRAGQNHSMTATVPANSTSGSFSFYWLSAAGRYETAGLASVSAAIPLPFDAPQGTARRGTLGDPKPEVTPLATHP